MYTVNLLFTTDLSFCFIIGGKTNQLNLQNTATKAIIQGLMPDQNYTVQLIAHNKDKESKPAQGQFRSMYPQVLQCHHGICPSSEFESAVNFGAGYNSKLFRFEEILKDILKSSFYHYYSSSASCFIHSLSFKFSNAIYDNVCGALPRHLIYLA